MTLRKETQMPKDSFSRMPHHRLGNAVVLDATQGPSTYRLAIKEMLGRFDVAEARVMTSEILDEITAERQKQEDRRLQTIAENEAKRASQREPKILFASAYKSGDPIPLLTFFKETSTEDLTVILTEISANPRHYNSIYGHEINRAIQVLKGEIASRNSQPQPSILTKLKEKLGAS